MDFADLDDHALKPAMQGDFGPLVAKLRSGEYLTRPEREFLADYLEGKVKLPPGKKARLQCLDELVAEAYLHLTEHCGVGNDSAQFQIAGLIGETETNVRKRVARAMSLSPIRMATVRLLMCMSGGPDYQPPLLSMTRAQANALKRTK